MMAMIIFITNIMMMTKYDDDADDDSFQFRICTEAKHKLQVFLVFTCLIKMKMKTIMIG